MLLAMLLQVSQGNKCYLQGMTSMASSYTPSPVIRTRDMMPEITVLGLTLGNSRGSSVSDALSC